MMAAITAVKVHGYCPVRDPEDRNADAGHSTERPQVRGQPLPAQLLPFFLSQHSDDVRHVGLAFAIALEVDDDPLFRLEIAERALDAAQAPISVLWIGLKGLGFALVIVLGLGHDANLGALRYADLDILLRL